MISDKSGQKNGVMKLIYNKELIAGKLRRWERYMHNYKLPSWEEIPDFGLYMEQVIALLTQYLDYLPPELKDDQFITAATINNYVRTKVMPEPIKKKYYRIHLAYLIMICTLKQSMSIAILQKMIPMDIPDEEVQAIYSAYARQHRRTTEYFVEQVKVAAGNILDHDNATDFAVNDVVDLISMNAVISGFSGLFANKLLLLEGKSLEGQEID